MVLWILTELAGRGTRSGEEWLKGWEEGKGSNADEEKPCGQAANPQVKQL